MTLGIAGPALEHSAGAGCTLLSLIPEVFFVLVFLGFSVGFVVVVFCNTYLLFSVIVTCFL